VPATPRAILLIGDSRLERACESVVRDDPALPQEVADLHATLDRFRAERGYGRAISAPQVGIAKRLIAMDLGEGPVTLVNPAITWRGEETYELWDDCMSLPDVLIKVRRHRHITVEYHDPSFAPRRMERPAEDISELLQHEIDHLDGILFTRRMVEPGAVRARARMP
jgi:peptide deformylase